MRADVQAAVGARGARRGHPGARRRPVRPPAGGLAGLQGRPRRAAVPADPARARALRAGARHARRRGVRARRARARPALGSCSGRQAPNRVRRAPRISAERGSSAPWPRSAMTGLNAGQVAPAAACDRRAGSPVPIPQRRGALLQRPPPLGDERQRVAADQTASIDLRRYGARSRRAGGVAGLERRIEQVGVEMDPDAGPAGPAGGRRRSPSSRSTPGRPGRDRPGAAGRCR